MRKTFRVLLVVSLVSVLALVTMGVDSCKSTGGGKIASVVVNGKDANFGFNVQAVDKDGDPKTGPDGFETYKGQVQYNDRAAGVKDS